MKIIFALLVVLFVMALGQAKQAAGPDRPTLGDILRSMGKHFGGMVLAVVLVVVLVFLFFLTIGVVSWVFT
jgi:hypothetical protein